MVRERCGKLVEREVVLFGKELVTENEEARVVVATSEHSRSTSLQGSFYNWRGMS